MRDVDFSPTSQGSLGSLPSLGPQATSNVSQSFGDDKMRCMNMCDDYTHMYKPSPDLLFFA